MIRKFLQKISKWGVDDEMDLFLKIGPVFFIFYRYRTPVICFAYHKDNRYLKPFVNDNVSKRYWEAFHRGIDEQNETFYIGDIRAPDYFDTWGQLVEHFDTNKRLPVRVENHGTKGLVIMGEDGEQIQTVTYHCQLDLEKKEYHWKRK